MATPSSATMATPTPPPRSGRGLATAAAFPWAKITLVARPAFVPAAVHSVDAVTHAFTLASAILVLVWILHFGRGASFRSHDISLLFNVHPLVMTLCFVLAAGEGIMAYKIRGRKKVKKVVHMATHFVALALGVFGVHTAFKFHREGNIPDMYTLHSWLGICTISLFSLQWVLGFVYFLYPKAPAPAREAAVPIHAAAGLAIFLMAICTAETGFVQKGAAQPGAESRLLNSLGLFVLLFGLAVSISTAIRRVTAAAATTTTTDTNTL